MTKYFHNEYAQRCANQALWVCDELRAAMKSTIELSPWWYVISITWIDVIYHTVRHASLVSLFVYEKGSLHGSACSLYLHLPLISLDILHHEYPLLRSHVDLSHCKKMHHLARVVRLNCRTMFSPAHELLKQSLCYQSLIPNLLYLLKLRSLF